MPPTSRAKAKAKAQAQPIDKLLLRKIMNRVKQLEEKSPQPTTKEHQMSFGILKSSDDMPEPPKKEKKKKKDKNK